MHLRYALLFSALIAAPAFAQPAGECPYPIIFMHGYTGSQFSWEPFANHLDVNAIWGPWADTYHAVLNAYENEERIAGPDGILNTNDDDVMVSFSNETNTLAPGCIYTYNFENFWNENPGDPQINIQSGDSPGGTFASESDSNEEAAFKQGYVLGRMIEAVLAANPGKRQVILVGHSMGGLVGREYLQRLDGNGNPRWWVNPNGSRGHRVAKLITVATPHRGSNLFGNPFRPSEPQRDGVPDINSSATRDLRYNYFCAFCSSPGPYLFGGNEGNGFGWHTDDINVDGDENDFIQGINIDGEDQGFDDPWDGTVDNPAFPLPKTVSYTWITSNNGGSDDDVVDLARQWIYNNDGPVPSDGVPYRLTDTLLTDRFHLDLQEDTDTVIRGLDEPDFRNRAYTVDAGITYAGTATVRSAQAPDGRPNTDPDWYKFSSNGGEVTVDFTPTPGLGGRLDILVPSSASIDSVASLGGFDFEGDSPIIRTPSLTLGGGTYYIRVRHKRVTRQSWQQPYTFTINDVPASIVATSAAAGATENLSLDANYPNPFNPETVIPFTIQRDGHVTLSVYDVMGRRIALLLDAELSSGSHTVRWNANTADAPLASGVYLVRLEGDGASASRQILLMK